MSLTHFESFEDAHMKLGLEGSPRYNVIGSDERGIISLKITDSPYTYNRILNSGNIVWFVGVGVKSADGVPIGNQVEDKQVPFLKRKKDGGVFPILRDNGRGVYVMGNYRVIDLVKKVTGSGFIYYHIKMYKAYDIPYRLKIEL